tara:strand:+ start:345 stop:809 length:465 start_codon:yes stop_codon:yes gene_type:complete
MIIKIISIGNKLNSWELDSINYYLKQLPKNLKIEFINLKSQQNRKYSKCELIQKESKLIMSTLSKEDFVVSCDMHGDQICSREFSDLIFYCLESNKTLSFVIGGSFGLSSEIIDNSNKVLSASLLTFPHKLFRLILTEQIFRAHSIHSNMPYHK